MNISRNQRIGQSRPAVFVETASENAWMRRAPVAALFMSGLFAASVVIAASADSDADKDPADWTETETGIPVTDPLTTEKCGSCHAADAKGNLSRISWVRASPEGWSQTIKRMVKLNGLDISPNEARRVVTYLATHHGLAPEEAKPVMYFAEHRIQDETNIPNEAVRGACASCHEFARPMSSRRSHREWALLERMHVALYPQAERQYERPAVGALSPDGDVPAPPAGSKPPMVAQVALDWLSKNATLHTPEWEAWRPRIQTPGFGGRWLVSAWMPGRGRFVGAMTVAPKQGSPGEFVTTTELRSIETGKSLSRSGTSLVYTGFAWRGTSHGTSPAGGSDSSMRETLWFDPNQSSAFGRWYWGQYHEFGFDVKLVRDTGAPVLTAMAPGAIRTGSSQTTVRLYGANLPADLKPQDVSIGSGVTVTRIVSLSSSEAVLSVDVAANATPGTRDVSIRGTVLEKALPIYSQIDYVKVAPDTALAHLGGIKYTKGYAQFVAIGYSNGLDGKPNTADDFAIGPIDATWSMSEFPTTPYDDDTRFVGKIDEQGLFTPNVEGPDPGRRFTRNNYGEIWVVATAKTFSGKDGRPLSGRAYLVTTVPQYKQWDQPEVSE